MTSNVTRHQRDNLTTTPYSVRNHDSQLVFFDGQLPDEVARKKGIRQQTLAALEHVSNVAAEAGVHVRNLMRTTVYLTEIDQSEAVTQAYDEFFDGQRPSRTVVGAEELPSDAAVQIEAIGVTE
ncbi:RidA family protein [Halorubrum sp. AJ67]|uniref:RidA family protein n=1 Tax=Halorubrum sp. AJ67 TaxID=1173487 RepID=UPI0003DBE5C9|nr:RidA family protein [Halorubrum sp. AJ67]CDK37896.1 endoribonuclease L-PSP [Halorubrum sp. AJ67]